MNVFPSGDQFEINHGNLRATIVEVGGGLRSFAAGDLEVVDGFPADEMCHDGRGQQLLPWPNRLAGGKYSFQGKEYQLPITETSHGNGIHGLVRWVSWTAESRAPNSVTMTHRLYPMPGYPFLLDLSTTYTLSDEGMRVSMHAVNAGTEPCPFGAGHHPYLSAGTPLVDSAMLRVPARTVHRYNEHLIPVERVSVEGTPLDFRTLRPISNTVINMDYTDLDRDADGCARVVLEAPEGPSSIEIWMDEVFGHVTVYTGETVQPPSRRRQGIAVEPMTCPPNAFVSGDDLITLQPGEAWRGDWGISVRQ